MPDCTRRGLIVAASAALAWPLRLYAEEPFVQAKPVRADLWQLANGRQMRLASIVVPDWPQALPPAAMALVEPLGDGRVLQVAGGQRRDRYGRMLGTLVDPNGDDPRILLLHAGLAVVRFGDEPGGDLTPLLDAERQGRDAGLGLWGSIDQAQVDAARADRRIGRFAIIEGMPLSADQRFEATYLDFAKDWRTSFAIRIAKRDVKRFVAAGLDPATLVGRLVRARGWPYASSGAMLQLDDPQELELVQ